MKFWKDKSGKWIDYKEFKNRFEQGMKNLTQYQLTVQQLRGMKIILLGLLCGIVICLLNLKTLWWLLIVLVGGFYVNVTQYIGTWQKKRILQKFEDLKDNAFDKGIEMVSANEGTPFEKIDKEVKEDE